MDARQKEQYLREYELLKKQGKPFFPYAVFKDSAMAAITLGVIIVMAVVLGAELGPKADPTSTTVTPRPEWYFFFLFELLRVVKPPALTFLATIIIPTICLVLLLLLPFFDRGPERHPLRRPIATLAGITTIGAMAYLSILGATAGSPTEIGNVLPAAAIARTLENPTPPMPSYRELPEDKKTALVNFLAQLKGEPEGGSAEGGGP